jgi:hypothetical protein
MYRDAFFSTTKLDRPLVAQFCANDPELLLEAAKLLCSKAEIDAVDINFGVNQKLNLFQKVSSKNCKKRILRFIFNGGSKINSNFS